MRWSSIIVAIAVSASFFTTTLAAQDKPNARPEKPAPAQAQEDNDTGFGKRLETATLLVEGPVGVVDGGARPRATVRPQSAPGRFGPGPRVTIGSNRGSRIGAGQSNGRKGLASTPKTEIDVRLPVDDSKPVLVMDSVGGFRMVSPEGFEPTPMLQIFSDGRVLTGRKSELVNEVEGKMDLVELQSLMVYVSDECRFFDITSEMLKSELEAKRVAQIMDAPTTHFEVNLKDHNNRVEVYALPHVAGNYSNVPSVASMVAIASRCRRIIAMTRLGTDDEAQKVLSAVNDSLAAKAPDSPEFTFDNLQFAEQFADGRRTASWVQNFEENGTPMMAYATYQIDTSGDDSVNLNVVAQNPNFGKRER